MARIRRLAPAEWSLYRGLRLAMLANAPGAFGMTLEEARTMTPRQWEQRVREHACFAAFDGEEAVGLVSGSQGEVPGAAEVHSMWVSPSHRRRGLGEHLIAQVAGWAAGAGYRELRLTVVDGNAGALAFYLRLGFAPTGRRLPYPNDSARHEIELASPLSPAGVDM